MTKNAQLYLFEGFLELKRNFLIYSFLAILFYIPKIEFDEEFSSIIIYFFLSFEYVVYNILLVLIIQTNITESKKSIKEYIMQMFKCMISYLTTMLSVFILMLPAILGLLLLSTVTIAFIHDKEYLFIGEIIIYIVVTIIIFLCFRKFYFASTIYLLTGLKNFEAATLNKKLADKNIKTYNILFIVFLLSSSLVYDLELIIFDSLVVEIITVLLRILFITLDIAFVIYILDNIQKENAEE